MSVKFDDSKIRAVLQEKTPEVTPTQLGRYRLVQAMTQKFGEGWRSNPKARDAMKHFDTQHDFHQRMRELAHQGKVKTGRK